MRIPCHCRHLHLSLGVAVALTVALVGGAAACTSNSGAGSNGPTVVATTSILGDVVTNVVGDDADVEVLMPAGVDPHEFQLSAQQAAQMQEADVIVANGLGFEAGMDDAIDAARDAGVPVYEMAPDVRPLPLGDGSGADDPHVFTDPTRVADGAENIATALADAAPELDTVAVRSRAAAYADEIRATDAAIEEQLSTIPEDSRVLVTNHEVFGYFADRYGFEVVGAVVPGGTTLAEPSSQELSDLADAIRGAGVPAIFADTSSPTDLADALADESGLDVEVVPLFSESLGEPGSGADTYLGMIRSNAEAITAALGRDGGS